MPLQTLALTIYWLALATWFGGGLFIALIAPVVLRTIDQAKPILPTVLSENLDNQHASVLGGATVSEILRVLLKIETICMIAILPTLAAQWPALVRYPGTQRLLLIVRTACYLAAAGLAAYDRWVVYPKMIAARDRFILHADDPDVANVAKDEFDAHQSLAVTLLRNRIALLMGMILFSGAISYAVTYA